MSVKLVGSCHFQMTFGSHRRWEWLHERCYHETQYLSHPTNDCITILECPTPGVNLNTTTSLSVSCVVFSLGFNDSFLIRVVSIKLVTISPIFTLERGSKLPCNWPGQSYSEESCHFLRVACLLPRNARACKMIKNIGQPGRSAVGLNWIFKST